MSALLAALLSEKSDFTSREMFRKNALIAITQFFM